MNDLPLDTYAVYVKLIVRGETPDDAVDYANSAVDHSDLLDQDGILGIEFAEDAYKLDEREDEEYVDHQSRYEESF